MSLIPLLYSDWWEGLDRPHRLFDQHFGASLLPDQLSSIHDVLPRSNVVIHPSRRVHYNRPWADLFHKDDEGSSIVSADKNQFQVTLDVQQFKPDEINVKVVDKCVVVEAKHEEKRDEHGWISRQFIRKYLIPEQCDIEQVYSKLSSDGVLTIAAPRKDAPAVENERTIKIEHTGQPAIRQQPQSGATKAVKNDKKAEEKMDAK